MDTMMEAQPQAMDFLTKSSPIIHYLDFHLISQFFDLLLALILTDEGQ